MSINGISGATGAAPTGGVGSVGGTSSRNSSVPPAAGAAATVTISTPGQLFSQLQQLSQQNPAEFKAVAAQLASGFASAAQGASGGDATLLSNLASRFQEASQTGSLQSPQGQGAQQTSGGHHHHHHHGGGTPAAGTSSAVQQAFESAFSTVTQALQGASASPLPASST